MTLDNLKTYSLDQADYFYRMGVIDRETFDAYKHLWQTSTVRFTQVCRCVECMKVPRCTCPEVPYDTTCPGCDAYRALKARVPVEDTSGKTYTHNDREIIRELITKP